MEITKAKEQAEDLVVRLRELVSVLCRSMPTAEREAQREQLRIIGESITHLEKKSVPVPEELEKLKGKLETQIQASEKHQVVLYFVKDQLSEILAEIGQTVQKGPKNGLEQTQA
jgi:hypothetical protein